MKITHALLISSALLLVGCLQPAGKEVVREIHVTPGSTQPNSGLPEPRSGFGGVDDGGGGNGLKGKPLESYIVRLQDVEEFKTFVQPIISELSEHAPLLARDMTYLVLERSWYFIPVKLDQISRSNIGAFFKTDQMAIQSTNDIWIDKNLYDQMEPEAKARLIVHELMMGVRILDQLSSLEKCFASAIEFVGTAEYRSARRDCFRRYPLDSSKSSVGLRISKDDYSLIRKLTAGLFTPGALADVDLDGELHELRFRIR